MSNNEQSEYGEFVNIMNFVIPMRLHWLPDNPAVELNPGERVFGPINILRCFSFLAPVQIRMHEVSSVITNQDGSYQDVGQDVNEIVTMKEDDNNVPVDIETIEVVHDGTEFEENEIISDDAVVEPVVENTTKYDMSKLPFDLDNVNWLKFSSEELEEAAAAIGIDITPYMRVENKKKRRWDLVRAIKQAAKEE